MSAGYNLSDNQGALKQEVAQRPQWLDSELYPFQSHLVEIDGNRIHYIDEGSGPILFFLHPSIGWSFMYADIIKELRTRFRCIALDLPGFGLSPAGPGYQHTLTNDSRLIERFIQMLGLTDVTLLAHDITGSIGLGVVGRRPEWFRAVIILLGFVWPLEEYPRVYRMVQLVGSPLFRDYLADLEQRLSAIQEMPALLIFGEADGLLKLGWLTRFEQMFPWHRSIVMPGCHHFPQVYDALGVATAIRRWWEEEIEP